MLLNAGSIELKPTSPTIKPNWKKKEEGRCRICKGKLTTQSTTYYKIKLGLKSIHRICNQCQRLKLQEKRQAKKLREQTRKLKRKKKKQNSIPRLKQLADKAFSDFIRNRDNWTCQTCGKKLDKHNAHCSHFVGRMNMSTRYDEMNCICQCAEENIFKEGNKPAFSLYLINKYGLEAYSQLIMKTNIIQKVTPEWLKEIIAKYTC